MEATEAPKVRADASTHSAMHVPDRWGVHVPSTSGRLHGVSSSPNLPLFKAYSSSLMRGSEALPEPAKLITHCRLDDAALAPDLRSFTAILPFAHVPCAHVTTLAGHSHALLQAPFRQATQPPLFRPASPAPSDASQEVQQEQEGSSGGEARQHQHSLRLLMRGTVPSAGNGSGGDGSPGEDSLRSHLSHSSSETHLPARQRQAIGKSASAAHLHRPAHLVRPRHLATAQQNFRVHRAAQMLIQEGGAFKQGGAVMSRRMKTGV